MDTPLCPDYALREMTRLMGDGMTEREAAMAFDPYALFGAALREIHENRAAMRDHDSLWSICLRAQREERNAQDMEQAIALWLAGWTSERPYPLAQVDVMSWFWRAPSKREGRPGRLYRSTNQAHMAMLKAP